MIDSFEKDGINFIGEAKIDRFEKNSDAEKVYYEKEGKNQVLEFDKIFLGTGRQANTKGLGIEELGIELNSNKTLKVNDYCLIFMVVEMNLRRSSSPFFKEPYLKAK